MSLSRPRRDREEEEKGDGAGGQDPRGSPPAKRPRRCCSCSCCHERKDFSEEQMQILKKEMQCMLKGFIEEVRKTQREMQEFYQNSQLQLNESITGLSTLISEIRRPGDYVQQYSSLRTTSDKSQIRRHRMKFENRCCHDKYSGRDVMADDDNPIKVAIYDHDNKIIRHGPLSSIQVKIVVLDGEFNNDHKEQWSEDDFCNKIVSGRPGKPPLFSNELYLRLENGVADLHGVKFQDICYVPCRKFRLGVMAADDNISEKIQEGISEPFAVKHGRGFGTKKDSHPSLSDPVYKLKQIARNGHRRKLLEQKGIKVVRDFLRFYNKDKDSLREVCGNISDHDWNSIVRHALSCNPGHGFYSYCIPETNATIFFDSLYKIVGAKFNGINISFEELNNTQKGLVEAWRASAYDNLKVVQYEDENAYNEHGLIFGDMGSCSMPPCPTLPTKFHDEPPREDEALENDPPRESPRPRQCLVKIVTTYTTVLSWKNQLRAAVSPRVMAPPNDPVDSRIQSPSWSDLPGLLEDLDPVSLERLLAEYGFSGVLSG